MSQEKIWAYFQNEGATSFDAAVPRYRYLRTRIRRVTNFGSEILNIGVGNGGLENLLLEDKLSIAALDPDITSINKLAEKGINGKVGLIQRLPFADNEFDVVVASEVLEHLDDSECNQALFEIHRVLKPDGYFIGTVPFHENLIDNLTVCPHCGDQFHRWGHQQSFDKTKLSKLLEQQLELINISSRSFVAWSFGPRSLIKSSIRWLLGRFGEQISSPHFYFEARKRK